jgi:hypothetical protein
LIILGLLYIGKELRREEYHNRQQKHHNKVVIQHTWCPSILSRALTVDDSEAEDSTTEATKTPPCLMFSVGHLSKQQKTASKFNKTKELETVPKSVTVLVRKIAYFQLLGVEADGASLLKRVASYLRPEATAATESSTSNCCRPPG